MPRTVRADLGPSDVHIDGPVKVPRAKKTMAEITTTKRKALPAEQFALPATRQYPIHDANHVRNAAARLEQNKGSLSAAQYAEAKRNIARAAKKFGIESMYLPKPAAKKAKAAPPRIVRRPGLHMHLALSPDGGVIHRVYQASDAAIGGVCMRGDGIALPTLVDNKDTIDRLATIERMLEAEQDEGGRASLADQASKLRALADDAAKPVWIQLAKVGTFRGHAAGPFELTPGTFDEIVRNFNATVNQRIPIDFEHASEEDAANGSIPVEGAPAQGWIIRLENRGAAGLWGLVEWLEPARTYIRDGKYKFFSPAIRFGAKDRVTGQPIGARMTSGALTNNPFLDGLAPLAAKDRAVNAGDTSMSTTHRLDASAHHMMGADVFYPKLRAILSLHPFAGPEECKDAIGKLRALAARATSPSATVDGVELGGYFRDLKDLIGMAEHEATPERILEAVEEMIENAIEQHEIAEHGRDPQEMTMSDQDMAVKLGEEKAVAAALRTEVATLDTRLKDAVCKLGDATARAEKAEADLKALRDANVAREERDLESRVDTAFATYKDAKKLTDKDKASMRIVAKSDPKLFDECYPVVAPNQQHLLRNIAGSRAAITEPHQMSDRRQQPVDRPANFAASTMTPADMIALADKYVRDEKMSREAAINRAYAEATRSN